MYIFVLLKIILGIIGWVLVLGVLLIGCHISFLYVIETIKKRGVKKLGKNIFMGCVYFVSLVSILIFTSVFAHYMAGGMHYVAHIIKNLGAIVK